MMYRFGLIDSPTRGYGFPTNSVQEFRRSPMSLPTNLITASIVRQTVAALWFSLFRACAVRDCQRLRAKRDHREILRRLG